MPMTKQDLQWFELRDKLPPAQKQAVEAAFQAATDAVRGAGLKADMSDVAASLEGAIIRFVQESNPH